MPLENPSDRVLSQLGLQLLSAKTAFELRTGLYELEQFLASNPYNTQARLLQESYKTALAQEAPLDPPIAFKPAAAATRYFRRYATAASVVLTIALTTVIGFRVFERQPLNIGAPPPRESSPEVGSPEVPPSFSEERAPQKALPYRPPARRQQNPPNELSRARAEVEAEARARAEAERQLRLKNRDEPRGARSEISREVEARKKDLAGNRLDVDELLAVGRRYRAEDNFTEALANFKKAQQAEPTNLTIRAEIERTQKECIAKRNLTGANLRCDVENETP
jgi:hypothetical protein